MKAKINNKMIKFPNNWTKNNIVDFCNQNFKICPYCGKIDIRLEHLNICNSTQEQRELINEQHYK